MAVSRLRTPLKLSPVLAVGAAIALLVAGLSMALINEPRVLIADEPTTALDVTVQAQILEVIQNLQRELRMAVIMITHDLGVVAEVTEQIAVMYAGRIVEFGLSYTIFAAPEHPYTWGLLSSIPRLDTPRGEELVPIGGRPPSLIHLPSGCSFHPRCPHVREAHTRVDPVLYALSRDFVGDTAETVSLLWPQAPSDLPPPTVSEAVEIMAGRHGHVNYHACPSVVYTYPQAAAVGATEAPFSATVPISGVAKTETYTRAYADSNGFLTLLSDGRVLTGAYALGPEAGEWLQQANLAIRARIPLERP